MSEQAATTNPPVDPAKPKTTRKRRRRAAKPSAPRAVAPAKANPFAGVTKTKCCDGCTEERCMISTTNICKHPLRSSDSGCGPVTMANRDTVRRILKRQRADD